MGCSSFSTFFFTENELAEEQEQIITAETLKRDHPKVREWIDTIHYAIQRCGITLLDTAPWYGHGTSEIVVGWALEDLLGSSSSSSSDDDEKDSIDVSSIVYDGSVLKITRDDLCKYKSWTI